MDLRVLKEKLDAARNTFDYRLEKVLFDLAEQLCTLMATENVNRTELAHRMGVSPAYITKVLNGNPNLTVKSLLKLADALGQEFSVQFAPKAEVAQFSAALPEPPAEANAEFEVEEIWKGECVASQGTQPILGEALDDFALAA